MFYRFPQVIWLAIYFLNIFQAPRIVQIIIVSGRYRANEGFNQRGVSGFGLFVPAVLFTTPCAIVCSAQHNRPQTAKRHRTTGALSSTSPPHPPLLFAGSVCPPLESDWPLALDWNWLHKGYNNERLLVFWQWQWRSVKGWDATVTRTTGFYINVLSSSQISKMGVGLWSERYCF